MAASEKICEFSGEYPGWYMRRYKRNRIQVMPKYRELFKDQPHVLFIMKDREEYSQDPWRKIWSHSYDQDKNVFKKYNKDRRWHEDKNYYVDGCSEYFRTRAGALNYCLYVPTVQGRVSGEYWNGTMNPSRAIRNIRKMLKAKKINIVRVSKDDDLSTEAMNTHLKRFYPDFAISSIEIKPSFNFFQQLEYLVDVASAATST